MDEEFLARVAHELERVAHAATSATALTSAWCEEVDGELHEKLERLILLLSLVAGESRGLARVACGEEGLTRAPPATRRLRRT